ncbi:hypothetical protein TNCV_4454401 [Trichonephila clavipes]|nr:hypothetical protein TNCV_4454401 [Trichonephila clavipes]
MCLTKQIFFVGQNLFLDSPLVVCLHKSLNSCRGVISETDLLCASEAEILKRLSDQGVTQILKPQLRPYLATLYSHQNLSSSANNLSTHFFAPEERSFSNGSHLIAVFIETNKPTSDGQRWPSKRQATSQGQIVTEENFPSYRLGCWQTLVLSARWTKTCSAFCSI